MEGVTRVRIGGVEIGIVDLEESFERIRQQHIRNEHELKKKLLQEVQKKNYVPPSTETDYTDGLFRAYKHFLGEEVEEEDILGLEMKILGPGCARCDKLERDVLSILTEMNIPAEVQHIRDPAAIAEYGLLGTPAFVINEVVKSAGRVPRRDEIMKWIQEFQDTITNVS